MAGGREGQRGFLKLIDAAGIVATMALSVPRSIEWGLHYVSVHLPPAAPVEGRIEVLEFFSYACPHCYRMEPTIEPSSRLPDDVDFRRVPVAFNETARVLAKA